MIPYGMHYIDEADINAVSNVLRDGFLTQGPVIDQFENAFAQFVGSKYAVAVSSCTAGLHFSLFSGWSKKRRCFNHFAYYICLFCKCWLICRCKCCFFRCKLRYYKSRCCSFRTITERQS